MDQGHKKKTIALKERIVVAKIKPENWADIGVLIGLEELTDPYSKIVRGSTWDIPDYAGTVLKVLCRIGEQNAEALDEIEAYLDEHFPDIIPDRSEEPERDFAGIYFKASHKAYPSVEKDLVAIIMPFAKAFNLVDEALKTACADAGFQALRPDDLWEQSTVIAEIIGLLQRSAIVVADLTGKNPNVMYETGVAHTLGKAVIHISQTLDDVPFDVAHYRILEYSPTATGLFELQNQLSTKLKGMKTSLEAAAT